MASSGPKSTKRSSSRAGGAKKTPGRTTNKTNGRSTRTTTRSTKNSSRSRKGKAAAKNQMKDEVMVLFSFACALILILSNFNLAGEVGTKIKWFMFGLFGVVEYVFPIIIACSLIFLVSNKDMMGVARIKTAAVYALTIFLSAAWQRVCDLPDIKNSSMATFFTYSAKHFKGGGFFGGLICKILSPLGVLGSMVIIIILAILCIILITEKSFIRGIVSMRQNGQRMMQAAKQDYDIYKEHSSERLQSEFDNEEEESEEEYLKRRRAEKEAKLSQRAARKEQQMRARLEQKENKKSRMENKALGVTLDTMLPRETQAEDGFDIHEVKVDATRKDQYSADIYDPNEAQGQTSQSVDFLHDLNEDLNDNLGNDLNKEFHHDQIEDLNDNINLNDSMNLNDSINLNDNMNLNRNSNYDHSFMSSESTITQEQAQLQGEDSLYEETVDEESMDAIQEAAKRFHEIEGDSADTGDDSADLEQNHAQMLQEPEDTNDDQSDIADSGTSETLENTGIAGTAGGAGATGIAGTVSTAGNATTESKEEPKEKPYQFPPLSLLKRNLKAHTGNQDRENKATAMRLQQTLQNFGVKVTITDISCGPAVTRFELQPEQGVKVSKIVSLSDDIKLNLAAADIRIEAPIPGKAAIGIEVPNKEAGSVLLRELLETDTFKNHPSPISFAAGKDIAGKTMVADIAKMPHLLIAGATGSGKSVCINTIIMSILYKAKPEEVKLIMIDPKVVELSVYNGIPHLMIPVVTDPKKASGALNWAVTEMTDRYKKFAQMNVRDLKGYNAKIAKMEMPEGVERPNKLCQLVIIIDELADLMMVAPGEVEDAICRLAQLARAAGIHLVIATQRPSVNVITGLIKANVPSRIAFSVSSGVDSRTIIDMNGAEKLLGKGDMLFFPTGYPKPVRVQGAFVSDEEVGAVVDFLKENASEDAQYNEEITNAITSAQSTEAARAQNERDPYFAEAGRFVIGKEKGSIGMLQRYYKIGFNRAARIMDQLADAHVVGPEVGTKPRKIEMTLDEFESFLKQNP